MASLNKAILIGNLGADPEVRYTASGDPVVTISIATSEIWRDKVTDEKKENTIWHRVVLYSQLAKAAADYLKKGRMVYVEGKMNNRKWVDQSGQTRYTYEIVASVMKILDKERSIKDAPETPEQSIHIDDDIPF